MSLSGIRILLVLDSAAVRKYLHSILSESYVVAEARNAAEALDACRTFAPHLILLDLPLSRSDGLTVIRTLRDIRGDRSTYIIVLAAESEPQVRTRALAAGADDYILKPFREDEAVTRIAVATRQVALARKLQRTVDAAAEELRLMARLQQKMLPASAPYIKGGSFDTLFRPSTLASGDFYDFFPLAGNRLRIVMADVSGHGAKAALIMAVVRTLLRATEEQSDTLPAVMGRINAHLQKLTGENGDFVTMFVADIDFATRRMEYINAGHCPGLLKPRRGGTRVYYPFLPMLGLFDLKIRSRFVDLPDAFGLFLYTDGMYEWRRPDGEMFDLEKFIEYAFRRLCFDAPFLHDLADDLTALSAGSMGEADDLTALWFQWSAHA